MMECQLGTWLKKLTKNTAWDKAYKLGQNSPITVDLIKSSVPVK